MNSAENYTGQLHRTLYRELIRNSLRQRQDRRRRPATVLRDRRGSALECAAIQDVLVVGKALDRAESRQRKDGLDRVAAMLSRLGGRGYQVQEDQAVCGVDSDPDSDFDLDGEDKEPQP